MNNEYNQKTYKITVDAAHRNEVSETDQFILVHPCMTDDKKTTVFTACDATLMANASVIIRKRLYEQLREDGNWCMILYFLWLDIKDALKALFSDKELLKNLEE